MVKEFTVDMQRKYLRIPFADLGRDYTACDCYGLAILVYKNELGIDINDYTKLYKKTSIENASELAQASSLLFGQHGVVVRLDEVQPFDVISFNIGGDEIHCGVITNKGYFLHIMEGGCSNIQSYTNIEWKKRVAHAYRHKSLIKQT